MSTRLRTSLILVSLLVALYVLIGGLLGQTAGEGAYGPLAVFSEVLTHIKDFYVEEPDIPNVTQGALHGLLESLDPYSAYLSPAEFTLYQKPNPAHTADLGVVLSKRFGMVSVVATLPDSPAERAGIRVGDILESIDGFSTRELSVEQAKLWLAGEPGSVVKVSVVRERRSEAKQLELVRAIWKGTAVASRPLTKDVGYLRVTTFSSGSAAEVAKQLERLQKAGARKLILDVRGCATGEVREAVETARLVLERGLIAYLEGQQVAREQFVADPRYTRWRAPLAVLIDTSTAGPAELIATAVREQQRGELIGEQTYGLGSVQKVIPLDDGAALILTVAKYHSPSGRPLQETGVEPTVPLSTETEPEEESEFTPPVRPALENDPFVLKALEVLRSKGAPTAERPAA